MKKFFLTLATFGLSLSVNAQTEMLMATLQHGDKTTVYYGENAFMEAYEAAADTLDVITLSGGNFYVPGPLYDIPYRIEKSLTINGAGFEPASSQGGQLTWIPSLAIYANGVHLQGICFDFKLGIYANNTTVEKCYAWFIYFGKNSENTIIKQCRANRGIQSRFLDNSDNYAKNLLITNCYLGGQGGTISLYPVGNFKDGSSITVDHCLIKSVDDTAPQAFANYINNISYHPIPDWVPANKNIFVINDDNIRSNEFAWWETNENLWAADGEDGTYADEKTWELKKPGDYIGTDGTQVGLLGGVYGWNKIPSIPRITELNVDTKNANNGTIKLTLKAEASNKE